MRLSRFDSFRLFRGFNRSAEPTFADGPEVISKVKQTGVNQVASLPLIVFDVNEALLDLTTMEPTYERIFGDQGAMRFWFASLITYSSALTVTVMVCAFYRYRFGRVENAGRPARHSDRGPG